MDWDNLYLAAINWGISPSEFWEMTLAEWFAIYDMHASRQTVGKTGMTEDELDSLMDWMNNDGAAPS